MIKINGLKVYFDRNRIALGSQDVDLFLPDGERNPDYYQGDYFASEVISVPAGTTIKGKHYGELTQTRHNALKANADEVRLYHKYRGHGTISHGTNKPEDVLPKMLDLLNELDPDYHSEIALKFATYLENGYDSSVDLALSMWELVDRRINEMLPEGLFFGANEGDASDFGIWQYPCDERDKNDEVCERMGYHEYHATNNGRVVWARNM